MKVSTALTGTLTTGLLMALALPDVREKLVSQGAEPFNSNPAQFAAIIRAETTKYAKAVKMANIKLDQ